MSHAEVIESPATEPETTEKPASVVDAVFDAALAWIDVGLGHVKTSLATTARAMEKTSTAVDTVREKLRG